MYKRLQLMRKANKIKQTIACSKCARQPQKTNEMSTSLKKNTEHDKKKGKVAHTEHYLQRRSLKIDTEGVLCHIHDTFRSDMENSVLEVRMHDDVELFNEYLLSSFTVSMCSEKVPIFVANFCHHICVPVLIKLLLIHKTYYSKFHIKNITKMNNLFKNK